MCDKMADVDTEADRLSSSYNLLEDTMDTDTLVQLREPMLQPTEESHSRTGSLHRLRHSRAYTMLASTKHRVPQYVKEDAKEDVIARARLRISRSVESLPVRVVAMAIVVIDVVLVAVQLATKDTLPLYAEELIDIMTLLFSAYFCAEVTLRIIGQGRVFFRRWFEVLDLVVVVVSSCLAVVFTLLGDHSSVDEGTGKTVVSSARLLVLGRLVRVVFWVKIFYEQKSIKRYIRSKVSQNRRRYIAEGYDLDLTYVTDRVIAMSFPASGSAVLYRNSIQEVGQFLDQKHPGHYRVYNLCSEKEYDTSYFHHQVQRVFIDDHNVPRLMDLVDFCEDVHEWMEKDERNVIAVHCKGGKGRTGMMVAAWLVRSGQQAQQSLAYFRERRTDRSLGSKNQGVNTPSQSRYVYYYERLLTEMNGELPPPTSLRLTKMVLSGVPRLGQEGGRDWRFEIFLMRNKTFECSLASPDQEQVSVAFDLDHEAVNVVFNASVPVVLTDDVRFKFYSSNKALPNGSEKCQFYFWFHTTFVIDNRLILNRGDLDNMQKSHVRRSYPPSFSIELWFESWTARRELVD